MKKGLAIWVLAIACLPLHARTIHVKEGGSGNGISWATAANLQYALSIAKAGDEIWVASGVHTPTTGTDRYATFQLVEGVSLFGGFTGIESSLDDRNISSNPTILSGEIGAKNQVSDNVYTVVTAKNVSSQTIVDGFIITGGNADAIGRVGEAATSGAAWYNESASPTIRNCAFRGNLANWGAAMFNFAGTQKCSPSILNCQFTQNKAHMDGGAIYNDGQDGQCTPQIRDCSFEGNIASYGGSVYNTVNNGTTRPLFLNCIFINNSSMVSGGVTGATYDIRKGRGACSSILNGCRIEENIAALQTDNGTTAGQPSTHAQANSTASTGSFTIRGNK